MGFATDTAKLLLRVTVGVLLLMHGIYKLRHGLGPIPDLVVAHGLPKYVAYGVYIGELVAPLLLIIGFLARPAGFVVAVNMGFAIFLAHRADWRHFTAQGAWALELQALYLVAALAIALLGSGRYSLSRGEGNFE
jgi:putative oxidoreductase